MDGRQNESALFLVYIDWTSPFFKKIFLKIDIRSYVRNTIVWEEIEKITLQEEKMGAERKR